MKKRLTINEHVDMAARIENASDAMKSILAYEEILTKKESYRIGQTLTYAIGELKMRLKDEMAEDYGDAVADETYGGAR